MVTTATLSVNVTANGARTAGNDLSHLARQSSKAEQAVAAVETQLNRMQKLLAIGGLASLGKQVLDAADKMQSLHSQLKQVTSGMTDYTHAEKALFEISQRTTASLEATTQAFVSTKRALAEMGVTTNQTLKFTETLNKAMAVGGVNAESQKSALLQLSQALGSGVLQGDEFRSIAENAPIILDVVAEYMGKTRAEVKKLASDGKITSKVLFEAISGASGKISAKFDEMPMTFGQAMQQMENAWLKFVDGLNSSGVMSALAQSVSFLAQNFDYLGLILGGVALSQLGKYTQQAFLSVRANQQQAATALQAAQSAATKATAEVNVARAEMQVLQAQTQLNLSERTRFALRQQMAAQAAQITQLVHAETAATANLARAQQAASLTGRATSLATGALNSAMGLLGGPAGVAMIAAGALFYFWQKGEEAKQAALDASRANELLAQSYKGLTAVSIQDELQKELEAYKEMQTTLKKLDIEKHLRDYFGGTKKELAEATNNYELAKQNFEITTKALEKHVKEFASTMLSEGKNFTVVKERLEALGISTEQINATFADSVVQTSAVKQQLTALYPQLDQNQVSVEGLTVKVGTLSFTLPNATNGLYDFANGLNHLAKVALGATLAVIQFNQSAAQSAGYGNLDEKAQKQLKSLALQQQVAQARMKGDKDKARTLQAQLTGLNSGFKEDSAEYKAIVTEQEKLLALQDQESMAKKSAKGGTKKEKTKSSEDYRNDWDKYYDDLVNANATAWEKIKYEQDVANRELEKHLSHGVVKAEEAEKARTLIGQQYAKQRMELAGQYIPEIAYREKIKTQLKDLEQLEKDGTLTTEQAARARQNLGAKYVPVVAVMEEYLQKLAEIAELEQRGIINNSQANEARADAEYEKWKGTADKSDPMNGIRQGWEEWAKTAGNTMEQVANITTQALDGMADQLTNFVMTGKADFRSFTVSILSDISKMIINMMILNAVKAAFGGFSGGGLVGSTEVNGNATYGMGTWATGGYTGNGSKYEPAGIVHKGEYVITKEATARLGHGFLDQLNYGGSTGYATGGLVGGSSTVPTLPNNAQASQNNTITITVNVDQNGNTHSQTEGQTSEKEARQLGKTIEAKVLEVLIKQKRNGNLLA
ncbi:phage tail tape measure protein [Haemophilus parahaemolyticus]|uniref:phage tail tape measure protein n=1 Tax=Haemophilus parahaemolyticus TaxID=735 RepID=UPI0028D24F57|nr:phage tail tape measure protein [Haemophilus parahaemolyticus]